MKLTECILAMKKLIDNAKFFKHKQVKKEIRLADIREVIINDEGNVKEFIMREKTSDIR